jgi:Leucine-rich repeat (LRR) protein
MIEIEIERERGESCDDIFFFFSFSFVGFEKLSSLRYLRILDLSYNYFKNNSILQSLSAMTSLETLNLTYNELQGYFPAQGGFFYLIFYESIYNLITLFLVIT